MTRQGASPGTVPVRGALALLLTVGSLSLLLSFRPPDRLPDQGSAAMLPAASAPTRLARGTDGADPGPAEENAEVRVAGDPVATRWGDVQVVLTMAGDDVVRAEAVSMPARDGRSRRLSEQAEPILRIQAISSDEAPVDVVSGATFTSRAYAASMQSALDGAG